MNAIDDPTLTESGLTEVVNVRTAAPGTYIYVGRYMPGKFPASPWGNPFKLARNASPDDRMRCLEDYRAWLGEQPHLLARLPELKGRRLGCWCAPNPLCHGVVLAELADGRGQP